jgi:hypothetical protein
MKRPPVDRGGLREIGRLIQTLCRPILRRSKARRTTGDLRRGRAHLEQIVHRASYNRNE